MQRDAGVQPVGPVDICSLESRNKLEFVVVEYSIRVGLQPVFLGQYGMV